MKCLVAVTCLLALTVPSRAYGPQGLVYAPNYASADYYAYPSYAYEYSVKDPHTGDNKAAWEKRDGDLVIGGYSLVEPGGSVRVVDYRADKNGFVVTNLRRIGPKYHPGGAISNTQVQKPAGPIIREVVAPVAPVVAPAPVIAPAPIVAPAPYIPRAPIVAPAPYIPRAPIVESYVPRAPIVAPAPYIPRAPIVESYIPRAPIVAPAPYIPRAPIVAPAPYIPRIPIPQPIYNPSYALPRIPLPIISNGLGHGSGYNSFNPYSSLGYH